MVDYIKKIKNGEATSFDDISFDDLKKELTLVDNRLERFSKQLLEQQHIINNITNPDSFSGDLISNLIKLQELEVSFQITYQNDPNNPSNFPYYSIDIMDKGTREMIHIKSGYLLDCLNLAVEESEKMMDKKNEYH